jgi:DNA recombination protein RmuC
MEIFIIIALVIIVAILAILMLRNTASNKSDNANEALAVLIEQNRDMKRSLDEHRQVMDSKLSETHRANQEHFGHTTRIIQEISAQSSKYLSNVTEKLTQLDETNKQIVNFSGQLQNLQDILKNPKQRGVLGEYFLEETLKNVLPPSNYQMQYKFKNGDIVDAVVFVKDKIIPIDSKFSLENYEKILNSTDQGTREQHEKFFKQDLKNRIDETSKYIKPAEKTMDFAFMFIPSEAIYYDLLVNKVGAVQVNTRDLIEYAFKEKHVIIVSPTSFLAYLQTVLQGLRALQIEESAKAIRDNVEKLGRHLITYDDYMKKVGQSLGTTVSHYNNAYGEFKKVDKDVARITDAKSEIETLVLDKPQAD